MEQKRNHTSPGNEGSRGSTGLPNSGAQAGNTSERGGDQRAREGDTDLRDADARGGGGAASGSSRSQDPADGPAQEE